MGGTALSKVLVVEDDPLIRLVAVGMVELAGFEAVEAPDADRAIAILEADPEIRLVFTDVQMPGTMDGLKLAHFIRDRWPPIHLIVASGADMSVAAHLPAGAVFLPKPYRMDEIETTLRSMIGA